jgi:ABC-type glutathione transport system ATPase component
MLSVDLVDCNIAIGSRLILENVSARFEWSPRHAGQVIGLMGPSGSGKTTLARAILDARYEKALKGLSIEPAEAVVTYLPQNPVLFTDLTTLQNAKLLSRVGRYRERFDDALFDDLVRLLHLEELLGDSVNVEHVSGGEAQRLMLLRTLSIRPDLLILDEPATGLDPTVRESFLIDLGSILSRLGIRALYVSHHLEEVSFLCSRVGFAVTTWPRGVRNPIRSLPVMATEDFRLTPPTPDAFIAVHGPGCSAVRLADAPDLFAFLPPSAAARPEFVPRGSGERLAASLADDFRGGGELAAALYRAGRFEKWIKVTNTMLADTVE